MNFDLPEEEEQFNQSFRAFCAREIEPFAEEADATGELPAGHFRALGDAGYLGLLHENRFGGQDANYVQATLAQVALAEACGSTFFASGASAGLFGGPIAAHGTDEQKNRYLPAIIAGKKIGCLAVTEPAAGSDVNGLTATARETDDGFVLNGQKTYITNAPICDYALVLARAIGADGRDLGLTHFIVDANAPGVARGKPMKKMGLRASPTGEVFFEDVHLPGSAVLGAKTGRGFRVTMEAFNKERLALAAYSVGVIAACFADSKRYSRERKAFGKLISKHQSVAFMLADIRTKYEAANLLLMETAWLFDRLDEWIANGNRAKSFKHNGRPIEITARAAEVKLLASTLAREATNLAVQIHGGAGYMDEYRVSRLYRDVKLAEIGGGTSEIQKQIVARAEEKRVSK